MTQESLLNQSHDSLVRGNLHKTRYWCSHRFETDVVLNWLSNGFESRPKSKQVTCFRTALLALNVKWLDFACPKREEEIVFRFLGGQALSMGDSFQADKRVENYLHLLNPLSLYAVHLAYNPEFNITETLCLTSLKSEGWSRQRFSDYPTFYNVNAAEEASEQGVSASRYQESSIYPFQLNPRRKANG